MSECLLCMFEQDLQAKYSYACGAGHCIYVHRLSMCTLLVYIATSAGNTFTISVYTYMHKFPVVTSES